MRNLKKIRRFLQKIEVFKCLKNVLSLTMSKLTARPLYNKKHVRDRHIYIIIRHLAAFENIAKICLFWYALKQKPNKILT